MGVYLCMRMCVCVFQDLVFIRKLMWEIPMYVKGTNFKSVYL